MNKGKIIVGMSHNNDESVEDYIARVMLKMPAHRNIAKIVYENQEDWVGQFGTCYCGQPVKVAEVNWYESRVTFQCGACDALHFATIFEEYGVFIIEKEKWIIP